MEMEMEMVKLIFQRAMRKILNAYSFNFYNKKYTIHTLFFMQVPMKDFDPNQIVAYNIYPMVQITPH